MSGHGCGDHGVNYAGHLGFGDGTLDNSMPPAALAIPRILQFEINGFAGEVLRQLPMEFAVEAQKLLGTSLEGSVG